MSLLLIIVFLTLLKLPATENNNIFDEDISYAVPEVILNHSPMSEPASQFLATVNNCECRTSPRKYTVCYGRLCTEFPSELKVTTPLFKFELSMVKTIRKEAFANYKKLEILEIESNVILETIEPGCFRIMSKLRNLTISFNEELKYLEKGAFEGLINLRTLYMQKNGFTKVLDVSQALVPNYLPELNLLALNENIFTTVDAMDFAPMNGTKLEQLNMILCGIEYIHPDSLAPLKHLLSLRLGQNPFNSSVLTKLIERSVELNIPLNNLNMYGLSIRRLLPQDLLNAIAKTNITFLHFTHIHIDRIDDKSAFPKMPKIQKLSLRECSLSSIGANALKGLSNLKSLYLTANRLQQIPEGALLKSLHELDVAANTNTNDDSSTNFFYIPEGIFINMSNLQHLQLAYNNINYLTRETFLGLQNLHVLTLKNSCLISIEPGTFQPLGNLSILNLINNPSLASFISSYMFNGLKNLKVLLLGGCSLQNLTATPSLFISMPNLEHIGLERNELFTISSNQFLHLANLRHLHLCDNKLATWNKRLIPDNITLKLLNANQNKFNYISEPMMYDFCRLEVLHLDNNPFSCDCSLYPVIEWLQNHRSSAFEVLLNSEDTFFVTCMYPDAWRHKSMASFLKYLIKQPDICRTSFAVDLTITILYVFIVLILCILCLVGASCMFKAIRLRIEYLLLRMRLNNPINKNNCCSYYKYDVFVSYCHDDQKFVVKLVERLEVAGISTCIYERDFTPGDAIPAAVAYAIATSKKTLLVVSNAFAKSYWCRWETHLAEYHQLLARENSTSFVIIKMEDLQKNVLTQTLKYLLKTRIYLEWNVDDTTKQKQFWEKLVITLKNNE